MSVAREIETLREEIRDHDRKYYVEAAPEISDLEYDQLVKRLQELEAAHPDLVTPDSPTQRVGGEVSGDLPEVKHRVPMLSIDNTYTIEDLKKFGERTANLLKGEPIEWVVELKIDGAAVSLLYENGELIYGARRGDGRNGDKVTHSIRTIRDVPLRLLGQETPRALEVRGEVYITNPDLVAINEEQAKKGKRLFKNTRNLAAGTIVEKDPSVTATRRLRFFCHGVGYADGLKAKSHMAFLAEVERYGIPGTPQVAFFESFDLAVEHCERIIEHLHDLDFEIDGLVLKVNDFEQRERLGATAKSPRWTIAYKFRKYEGTTRVRDIRVQVGKSGAVTPVAFLEPIELAGTTVSRASLHNADEIRRKDVRPGDVVIVEKAGKIIPHVVRVEKHERQGELPEYHFPEACPECATPLVKDQGGVYIRCPNVDCPARLRERLQYFASRKAMDIEELGEKIVEKLVSERLVHTYADLYRLKVDDLIRLKWKATWGEKRSRAIVQAISASKTRGLATLLYGLAIPCVGGSEAITLSATFRSIDALVQATPEQIGNSIGLGSIFAESIRSCLHTDFIARSIEGLKRAQVSTEHVELSEDHLKSLRGKKPPRIASVEGCRGTDLSARISHYATTDAMDITGLGETSINILIAVGLVKAYDDLYRLKPEQLSELERTVRMSAKEARKVLDKIEASKTQGLARLLNALAIRHVGPRIAGMLAEHFHSMDAILQASSDEIAEALRAGRAGKKKEAKEKSKGGETAVIAKSVYSFLQGSYGSGIIHDLTSLGLNMQAGAARTSRVFEGKTFVVTGTLAKYGRDEINQLIERHGGHAASSVSKNTDFVVAGENAGSKLSKAQELHIPIITEEEFEQMLKR